MMINGVNIEEFNAKLLQREVHPVDFAQETVDLDDSLEYKVLKTTTGQKTLDIVLELSGNKNETSVNKSNLLSLIVENEVTIQFSGLLDKLFVGRLTKMNNYEDYYIFESVSMSFKVYEVGKKMSVEMNNNTYLKTTLDSNMKTPAVVKFVSDRFVKDLTIVGLGETIFMSNIIANTEYIIDGVNKKVSSEGFDGLVNEYDKYESWSFPILKPGVNEINFGSSVSASLECNPRWF